jgi:hypothetical protein
VAPAAGGRSLVAGLFRRGLLRRLRRRQSGEKLERSSSSHRPLRLTTTRPPDSPSTSEGKPGAATPAWVFERSLEGESEIPRVSAGRDAVANARWNSTGLPERNHRLRGGRSLVAGLFRRGLVRDFCSPKWRKTRTLLELPPSPPPRRYRLRGGRSLVAGFFRRGLVREFSAHRSGEKLERSSSSHRPLRLVGRY